MPKKITIISLSILIIIGFIIVGVKLLTVKRLKVTQIWIGGVDCEEILLDVSTVDMSEDRKQYQREDAEKQVSMEILGEKYSARYLQTVDETSKNYAYDCFITDDNHELELYEDGQLNHINLRVDENKMVYQIETEKDLLAIANPIAEQYIYLDQYEANVRTVVFKTSSEFGGTPSGLFAYEKGFRKAEGSESVLGYRVTYNYLIDGIKTGEWFEISISEHGIHYLSHVKPGEFTSNEDRLSLKSFDAKSEVKKYVEEHLRDDIVVNDYHITECILRKTPDKKYYVEVKSEIDYRRNDKNQAYPLSLRFWVE